MTKEQTQKRFIFDLNTGVFKSYFYSDNYIVPFKTDSSLKRWSLLDLLEDLGYKCVTNSNPYYKLYTHDIICICYEYKQYGLYTDYEYHRIRVVNKLESINKLPDYIVNYDLIFEPKEE